jgi:hypothetical protein
MLANISLNKINILKNTYRNFMHPRDSRITIKKKGKIKLNPMSRPKKPPKKKERNRNVIKVLIKISFFL